jgi:hypothetical protein
LPQNGSHQPNFLLVTKSTLIIVIVNILFIADYCFCRPILLSPLAWSSLIPSNTIIHLFDRRRLCFRHRCRLLFVFADADITTVMVWGPILL